MRLTIFQRPTVAVLALLLAPGCGASAASYSGVSEPPVVPAARVQRAEGMPLGYERLGRVSAGCSRLHRGPDGGPDVEAEPFANVDCTRARIERVLSEKAAEVGGELLVGLDCSESRAGVRCRALVGRSNTGYAGPAPNAIEASELDEPRASSSFDIVMTFDPKARVTLTKATAAAAVIRSGTLAPDQIYLGDLEAKCDRGECEATELEWALRVSAAKLGAESLAGVRCLAQGDELSCAGKLGVSELGVGR